MENEKIESEETPITASESIEVTSEITSSESSQEAETSPKETSIA